VNAFRRIMALLVGFVAACVWCATSFATTYVSTTTYHSNVAWTAAAGPYVVTGQVTIGIGAELTIEPGTIVKFASTSSSMSVHGGVVADGTAGAPITFTSLADDSVGGDTGADGPTSGSPGGWSAIKFWANTSGSFDYSVFRYGGYGFPSYAYGVLESLSQTAAISVDHSSILYSASSGVQLTNGSATIAHSDISFNAQGVSTANGPLSISGNTRISNNTAYGLWMNYSAYGGPPLSILNSEISSNGNAGVRIQVGNTAQASLPVAHHNNIYGNNAGAFDSLQISVLYDLPTADWSGNYFGWSQDPSATDVNPVPTFCPWAPATAWPYHVAYSIDFNDPFRGPVSFHVFSNPDNSSQKCAADQLPTVPIERSVLDNSGY
jgi:hypothetical protein